MQKVLDKFTKISDYITRKLEQRRADIVSKRINRK